MEKCLKEALGVVTCGDLYHMRAACMHVMTPNTSHWLIKVRTRELCESPDYLRINRAGSGVTAVDLRYYIQ